MYCNDVSRDQAHDKFQDKECEVAIHVMILEEHFMKGYSISLRAVIIRVREAFSIAKLRDKLKEINHCLGEFFTTNRCT